MKRICRYYTRILASIIFLVVSLCSQKLSAQVSFWTEDFDGVSCTSGCSPTLIGWTSTNTGANSTSANDWYFSCAENGQSDGICGAGCGADNSLHVGSTTLGDIGAAFDASQATNKRIESPTIDCTGKSTIAVNFNYITNGEAGLDFCTLMYYNGTNWSSLGVMPVTTCCGGPCNGFRQGRWTAFNIALPATANNNANVKIGFNWTNNNVSGNDPSFAVDDISVTYVALLPVGFKEISAQYQNGFVNIEWTTSSETNNDFFTVQRSNDGVHFEDIIFRSGGGNSNVEKTYFEIDTKPLSGTSYYRVKQTDFDGKFSYSSTVAVFSGHISNEFTVYPNPSSGMYNLFFEDDISVSKQISVFDYTGRKIITLESVTNYLFLNLSNQPEGIYFVELNTEGILTRKKIIKQ